VYPMFLDRKQLRRDQQPRESFKSEVADVVHSVRDIRIDQLHGIHMLTLSRVHEEAPNDLIENWRCYLKPNIAYLVSNILPLCKARG
jgi:hypothetical protein